MREIMTEKRQKQASQIAYSRLCMMHQKPFWNRARSGNSRSISLPYLLNGRGMVSFLLLPNGV
jgi:hypothetical protein